MIKTYDAIRELRDAGVVVAGGFHSPMERECFDFLLRGRQSVVLCPASGQAHLPTDRVQVEAIEQSRLVVVVIFGQEAALATQALAQQRNEFVTALSLAVIVPHATRGGKAEAAAVKAIARGQRVLTFADAGNGRLIEMGATPVTVAELTCARWAGTAKRLQIADSIEQIESAIQKTAIVLP